MNVSWAGAVFILDTVVSIPAGAEFIAVWEFLPRAISKDFETAVLEILPLQVLIVVRPSGVDHLLLDDHLVLITVGAAR